MTKKNFLFIVQGEGRGHLTQAIALSEILRSAGHEISAVMVGLSEGRNIPDFFHDKIASHIIPFHSPSLVYGAKTKSLDIRKTLINSIIGIPMFVKSILKMRKYIKQNKPDVIINFYDVLAGIHQFIYRPNIPMICIAHQYLMLHKAFIFPEKSGFDKFLVNLNTQITALGASKKLALSFNIFPDDANQNIIVVPPLLRSDVKKNTLNSATKPFILAYMTIPSMAEALIKWHENNHETEVHCFWDKAQETEEYKYSENLIFHKINAEKFLKMMKNCVGLVSTAGFETVSEAMSLGKPVLMVPIPKHFEQNCNALDGVRAGAGIAGNSFDLSFFLKYISQYHDISPKFNAWQSQANYLFIKELVTFSSQKTPQISRQIRKKMSIELATY